VSVISSFSPVDPNHLGHSNLSLGTEWAAPGRGEGGPASKSVIVSYGFWIFLLSDIVMFSAFFAAYQVLAGNATDAAPSFDLSNVAIETGCLLLSSFLCGVASLCANRRRLFATEIFLLLTGVLGAVFLTLEIREFVGLIQQHQGPTDGAYYSAFFALVGCHGLHITVGLLWLGTMMAQIFTKGFRHDVIRRLTCFSLFWHALDIVWVAIFSLVYLMRFTP
jgi:cytochrome o ubiquinol oxidase subunit III